MPRIWIDEGDGQGSWIEIPYPGQSAPPPPLIQPQSQPQVPLDLYTLQQIAQAISGQGFTDQSDRPAPTPAPQLIRDEGGFTQNPLLPPPPPPREPQAAGQGEVVAPAPPTTFQPPAPTFRWIENPMREWGSGGVIRRQVPSSEVQQFVAQGWSTVDTPLTTNDLSQRGLFTGINIDSSGKSTTVSIPTASGGAAIPGGSLGAAPPNLDQIRDAIGGAPSGGIPQPGGGLPGAGAGIGGVGGSGGGGTGGGGVPIVGPQQPGQGLFPDTGNYGTQGLQNPAAPSGAIGPPTSLDLEETSPRAAFLRGLSQRGVDLNSIFGRTQQSRANDFLTTYVFGQLLQGFQPQGSPFQGGGQPVSQDSFSQFARENDISGVRRGAAQNLGTILSGGAGGEFGRQLGQPTSGQADALADLARTALESRISPLALRLLNLPSGTDLRDRFLAEGGGGSFLDYFRSQFPLAS